MIVDSKVNHTLAGMHADEKMTVITVLESTRLYEEMPPYRNDFGSREEWRRALIEFEKEKNRFEVGVTLNTLREIFPDNMIKNHRTVVLTGTPEQIRKLMSVHGINRIAMNDPIYLIEPVVR